MRVPSTQQGFALIVALVLIVVGAILASTMAFMTATSGTSAGDNMQSGQALFLAESGIEFGQRQLAQNLDWYRDTADPTIASGACAPSTSTQTLGQGTFNVCTNIPATMLKAHVASSGAVTLQVYTTDRFPNTGTLQIDDDLGGSAEFVTYTSKTATTFNVTARGQSVGTVTSTAQAHFRSDIVYPVTTLTQAGGLANSCATPTTFQIADNTKFLTAGTVIFDDNGTNHEEITYTGSTRSGGTMTLTGVSRCQNGSTSAAWAAGSPVTPLLNGSLGGNLEAEIMAQGTVGNTVREMRKIIQR
jgi:Tfp pilus assembly protein PilX